MRENPDFDILKMAHEMAQALHEVGAMDDATLRKMDDLCKSDE
jgi:putative transcriptional regulator